ncbi:MAG TPA: helix-turn-helix domain-containing protein [Kofleriaceae bacterium]
MARETRTPPDTSDPQVKITDKERKRLKKRRKELDMSTREVAAAAGNVFSHGTVTNIERGIQLTLARSMYLALLRVYDGPAQAREIGVVDEKARQREIDLLRRLSQALPADLGAQENVVTFLEKNKLAAKEE